MFSFLDYLKYNIFNIRTPELVEKARMKEYADKINRQKYVFLDLKNKTFTPELANYVFGIYKVIGPILQSMKEEFIIRDGKKFANYLIVSEFDDAQIELLNSFEEEYILDQIKKTNNINAVFNKVKNNLVELKNSILESDSDKFKDLNTTFNLLKDFASLSSFDFYLFLKTFCPTLPENTYEVKPTFRAVANLQLVDDLIKLDEALQNIIIKKDFKMGINRFCEYCGKQEISDKNINILVNNIKYLKTPDLLSDIIIFLLKDFKYQCKVSVSNVNIVVAYVTDITNTLKNTFDSLVNSIKNSKISSLRNKVFQGREILRLVNISDDKNEALIKYDILAFDCIEPIQDIKTFAIEIFEREYREPLNELFLNAEFESKGRSSEALDAFYVLNDVREKIIKFDNKLGADTDTSRKFRLYMASKQKAAANRGILETIVKQINDEGKEIIIDAYNAVLDISTIVKNIVDDCRNNTKNEILNKGKIQSLMQFNLELGDKLQQDFESFIALIKYYIR